MNVVTFLTYFVVGYLALFFSIDYMLDFTKDKSFSSSFGATTLSVLSAGTTTPRKGGPKSSETNRQLSNHSFWHWVAGVIDGDGHISINKYTCALYIKLHNRDIGILTHIQDTLQCGEIRSIKNKPYCQ